jgi:hypothetical protein
MGRRDRQPTHFQPANLTLASVFSRQPLRPLNVIVHCIVGNQDG